jgi:hypothetical protein
MTALLAALALVACSHAPPPEPAPARHDETANLARAAADGAAEGRRHAARGGIARAVTGGAIAPEPAPAPADDYVEVDWTRLMPHAELDALRRGDAPAIDHRGNRKMSQSGSFHTVATYTGHRIRLAGYVVPIAYDDAGHMSEFLFVPYFGACIHVPPPPPNQLVHVRLAHAIAAPDPWEPQWLRGVLREERVDSEIGNAAYAMDDATLAPYDG